MTEFNEKEFNTNIDIETTEQPPENIPPQHPQTPITPNQDISNSANPETYSGQANNVEAEQPLNNNVYQNYSQSTNPHIPYQNTAQQTAHRQPPYSSQPNAYVSGYNPQQPPRPPYTPPVNPQPPYQNQQQQDYYRMTYGVPKPEKQRMSPGLKALIIIIISVLTACVLGFTVYITHISNTSKQSSQTPGNSFSDDIFGGDFFGDFGGGYEFTQPTSPTFSQEQSSDKKYEQSDASDKIDPDYKGVVLESKPKDKTSTKYNASYSFNKLHNSVVGVVCYYEEDEGTENYQSQGTGIIITDNGYIVTNSHVIGNSRKAYIIKVITADKKEYTAGVVGYDSRSDLAVLKIHAKGLQVAQFGSSLLTEITEEVIAIGNPSGIEFQNSVTKGIVSALDREVSTSNNVEFIQIDAAINPGNSGGPLCNMYGQVIGINTAKIASQEYEGMGFAIPSATMKKIVDDIIRYGYVTNRVKVGISGVAVYEQQAGANGIQISSITEGGPMDGTGAEVEDIITAVDGEKVTTFAEIFDILEKHKEGDKVKVTLYRPSTKNSFDVEITLQIDKAND